MSRLRKTVSIGDAVERALKRADRKGKRHGARAVVAWSAVMGPEIAKHTRGFAVRDGGELVVFVDGPAWANQLSLMAEDLRGALNKHLGQESVRSIRFTVSRKVSEEMEWEAISSDTDGFYEIDEPDAVPLDDTEREQAAHFARSVKDPELRELALRVMIKDLERKKGARESAAENGRDGSSTGPDEGASQH